jgi:hypothetical protein
VCLFHPGFWIRCGIAAGYRYSRTDSVTGKSCALICVGNTVFLCWQAFPVPGVRYRPEDTGGVIEKPNPRHPDRIFIRSDPAGIGKQ